MMITPIEAPLISSIITPIIKGGSITPMPPGDFGFNIWQSFNNWG